MFITSDVENKYERQKGVCGRIDSDSSRLSLQHPLFLMPQWDMDMSPHLLQSGTHPSSILWDLLWTVGVY